MRNPVSPRSGLTDRVNMTPMIDVVFLLIIFFLVSSHLARREFQFPVDLAEAQSADDMEAAAAAITLTIDAEGILRIGDLIIEETKLATYLTERLSDDRDRRVRLRMDRGAVFQSVRPVLAELARLGIDDVTIATRGG